jgi:plastocyanin
MRNHLSRLTFWTRRFWVILSLVMVSSVILVACGGSSTPTTATTPTAAPTTAPTPTPTPTPLPATIPLGATIVQMIENPPGHYIFQPASVTIKAGSVIVWIDMSDAPHTITSDPGDTISFNTTSNVTEGHSYALVFTVPGTYPYHCNIHPTTMKGTITVTP